MMRDLVKDDSSRAAFYAGLFIASFSLTESLTSFAWGVLSDRIGRKPVVLVGCAGTFFSLILLGFSRNIWVAITARALGGALNGNVAVVNSMVCDIGRGSIHECWFLSHFFAY
jgi:MFS family permease